MRIDGRTLFRIVPDAAKSIASSQAVSITRKRYCSRVHVAGYCTINCDNCSDSLQAAFTRLNKVEDIKSPEGLLTYLMRDEAVKHIESERGKEKTTPQPEVNWLGERTEQNPFLAVLEA